MRENMMILALGIMLGILGSSHGLSFSKTFGYNMVLQRDVPASVWGFADVEGETVEIVLDGTVYQTTAYRETTGELLWSVQMDPQPAGGPFVLTLRNADQSQVQILEYVMFGDVWFCSGQSNMEMEMFKLDNPDPDLDDSINYPNVRVFRGTNQFSAFPQTDVIDPAIPWSFPSRETVTSFSAICFLFGRRLNTELGVPIGLIDSTWGGTIIEAWSSPDALAQCNSNIKGPNDPSELYNAMVYPYTRMAIKGANWYQGESNMGYPESYSCMLTAMIQDWGAKWNALSATPVDFPFGIVQLAPWRDDAPYSYGYPDIRWAQTANYGYAPNEALPNTFVAVSLDLPDQESPWESIHPRYKRPIAERLALGAFPVAYGLDSQGRFQGPFPSRFILTLSSVIIEYDNTAAGLDVRATHGFEVCCSDDASCDTWVDAPIANNEGGVITLDMNCFGLTPRRIRYLWQESPCALLQCPIYSFENELPAPPFIADLG